MARLHGLRELRVGSDCLIGRIWYEMRMQEIGGRRRDPDPEDESLTEGRRHLHGRLPFLHLQHLRVIIYQ